VFRIQLSDGPGGGQAAHPAQMQLDEAEAFLEAVVQHARDRVSAPDRAVPGDTPTI
jgi:hypothetical protein